MRLHLRTREYRLRIIAKGPRFERQQQIPFRVKPELVAIKAVIPAHAVEQPPAEGEHAKEGEHAPPPPPKPQGRGAVREVTSGGSEAVIEWI